MCCMQISYSLASTVHECVQITTYITFLEVFCLTVLSLFCFPVEDGTHCERERKRHVKKDERVGKEDKYGGTDEDTCM